MHKFLFNLPESDLDEILMWLNRAQGINWCNSSVFAVISCLGDHGESDPHGGGHDLVRPSAAFTAKIWSGKCMKN